MNNKDIELLKDKYAMGTLSAEEHASLQVELLQNPTLENDLNIHRDLVQGINYAGELELKDMMDKIHYQHTGTKPKENGTNNIYYYLAGLLILIGTIAYFVFSGTSDHKTDSNKIYAAFYTQYKPSLQNRGAPIDEAIVKFNEAYAAGNYQQAVQIIKPYLVNSSNEVKLTAAIAAIEVNDLVLSEKLLNDIIADNDYFFGDHAIWYKALIKLKTNELHTIEKILTPLIANPKADHHNQAKDLIATLKG